MRTNDTITLSDGRLLDIYLSGPVDGLPLLFHHGTPGCRQPERAIERAAHARGLRYVCASRAGYGGSTRRAGRTIADVVGDSEAVLRAIGASQCVVGGHSGGGPHALACAAGLEGVRATLVIAGVGPYGVDGLEFLTGMGEDNVVEFGNAVVGESVLRPALEAERPQLLNADPEAIAAMMASILPAVDVAVLTDEVGDELVLSLRESLRDGVDGWVDDDLAFVAPWGFSLDEISVPVTLWQGDLDLMVPYAHGQWLAGAVPGVDAHLLADEGHISIAVGKAEQMLDTLLALT